MKSKKIAGPSPSGKKEAHNLPDGGAKGGVKTARDPKGQVGGSPKVVKTDAPSSVTKVGSNPSLEKGKRFK